MVEQPFRYFVNEVSTELLTNPRFFFWDNQHPLYLRFSELYRQGIQTVNPNEYFFRDYCLKVMEEVFKQTAVPFEPNLLYEAPSLTIAQGVMEQDSIFTLPGESLRFMFDLSLGIAVDHYQRKSRGVERNAAYADLISQRFHTNYRLNRGQSTRTELLKKAGEWEQEAESFLALQNKLRERV